MLDGDIKLNKKSNPNLTHNIQIYLTIDYFVNFIFKLENIRIL